MSYLFFKVNFYQNDAIGGRLFPLFSIHFSLFSNITYVLKLFLFYHLNPPFSEKVKTLKTNQLNIVDFNINNIKMYNGYLF